MRVLVNEAALKMLVAAGRAVYAAGQRIQVAGEMPADSDHQTALKNAIEIAERALGWEETTTQPAPEAAGGE